MKTYNDIIQFAPLALMAGNRGDLRAEMPNIVRRAQVFVMDRIDHDAFKTRLPDTTISADGVLNETGFPDGIFELRGVSIEIGTGRWFPLRKRSWSMCEALYSDGRPGRPRYYGEDPDGVHVAWPPPGRVTPARASANVAPPILSPTQQTNLLSEKYPQLMEYAAAREAATFMLDETLIGAMDGRLGEELVSINKQIGRRNRDESAQRPVDTRNAAGS